MRKNRKSTKRATAILLAMLMVLTCVPSAFAASDQPTIKKVDYEKYGKVEVDFTTDVTYRNAKISVKDASGNRYSAYFTDRKNYEDDVEFIVKNYKAGKTYNFTISGIKCAHGSGSYTSVNGTFKIPAANSVKVKKVEYDDEDQEVTFEFANNVTWKNYRPTVKITTMNGTQKKVTFLDKDRDEVEVRANLTPGQKYKYTIYGVKARGASAYKNVSGTFRAIDD